MNGLDGVDDDEAGLQIGDVGLDGVEIGLRDQVQLGGRKAQPVRPHLHLLRRLLPSDVKSSPVRGAHAIRHSCQQRALTDPRISSDENK